MLAAGWECELADDQQHSNGDAAGRKYRLGGEKPGLGQVALRTIVGWSEWTGGKEVLNQPLR